MTTTTNPTECGFHCNGDCWARHGGDVGLIATLRSYGGDELTNWIANAQWTLDTPPTPHYVTTLSRICPVQNYVYPELITRYRQCYDTESLDSKHYFDAYPTVFRIWGAWFAFQGTHRLAAWAPSQTFFGWQFAINSDGSVTTW